MPNRPPDSFTYTYSKIVDTILTPVKITQEFDPLLPLIDTVSKMDLSQLRQDENEFWGAWDTCATGTHISQRVVDALSLEISGFKYVNPAVGESVIKPTYDVSVYLPNNVCFQNVEVTLWDFDVDESEDILVGMDIISKGDFALTNQEGKTKFSFRLPSCTSIDFVLERKKELGNPGRNAPCPCGSNKKYKRCCGL